MFLFIKSSKLHRIVGTNLILSGISYVNISRSLNLYYLDFLDLICLLYKMKLNQIIMYV